MVPEASLGPPHGWNETGGLPATVWAVGDDGLVYEARLTNHGTGEYHGFPLLKADAFTDDVKRAWEERSP